MRMSCNGCRVLRKGCSDDCTIRPCLQWIGTAEAQANATVFLAKFYGRAGLINLINSGPEDLRPAIFRSLLFEACGRIVNPIYGSVGMLWSDNWSICQKTVEKVLRGEPIRQISSDTAVAVGVPGLKLPYDIRHIAKRLNTGDSVPCVSKRSRIRFKRSSATAGSSRTLGKGEESPREESPEAASDRESGQEHNRSVGSWESMEHSHVTHGEAMGLPFIAADGVEGSGMELDLRLGLKPPMAAAVVDGRRCAPGASTMAACPVEMEFTLGARGLN